MFSIDNLMVFFIKMMYSVLLYDLDKLSKKTRPLGS